MHYDYYKCAAESVRSEKDSELLLEITEKSIREKGFEQKKKKPGFNLTLQWRPKELGTVWKSPSKQLLRRNLSLRTIFCSALGSSRRPPTSPSNVVAKKSTHFHPFWSKFNFGWGGRGGVASFSNITGKVPTLLASFVG